MTDKELTWIATVFDCEGCLDAQKGKYPRIQIGHTQLDVIERFHSLVGFGKVYGHNYDYQYKPYMQGTKGIKKQIYWWKIHKRSEVEQFFALIWNEWISQYRREKAIELGVAPNCNFHNYDDYDEVLERLKKEGLMK